MQLGGLGEVQRILAGEVVAAGPSRRRGTGRRRFWPSWSICQRRSMSSISWSERPWSWARCSGVIELSIACMAAMRWAMTSSSSSRFWGFSGKKSP